MTSEFWLMQSSGKKVFFAGHLFFVDENVYEPAEDSFLFAENLTVKKGDRVVDVGAGCGILGIVAAAKGGEILGVDINPWAVKCAKENARLNHIENSVSLVQGDLFAPISAEDKFDLILFNAPYLPVEVAEGSWLERSWSGGVAGRDTIDLFIREAPKHLAPNGRILLMQSTLSDMEETLQVFKREGLSAKVIAEQRLPFFETIVLLQAWWRKNEA
jgi:release factor glutamine methyltransferase